MNKPPAHNHLRADLEDPESALADFTEFLRQQPVTVVALRARALSYLRLQRFDEALVDLDEALRVAPASADAHLERGRIYQDSGHYACALADYQKGSTKYPRYVLGAGSFSPKCSGS